MSEGDAVQETPLGQLSVEDALQIVLKKSLAYDGLARGLRESVKALDRNEAHLCVLAESVDEKDYVKLVEALCAEHKIPLIKVSSAEEVGKWVGLCKLDREGVPRKINECGVCVVKDFGEESEAVQVLLNSIKQE